MDLPNIEIDPRSGFCPGVVTAIKQAEAELEQSSPLYCLGDIVHNSAEVKRLGQKGLVTVTHDDLPGLHGVKMLLRAHGEPPTTYELAKRNNITLVDATCPVVLALQRRVKAAYEQPGDCQVVIYGKAGHAEVNGLVGQTKGEAIVVQYPEDLDKIDYSRPVMLFSQTTMSISGFNDMANAIRSRMNEVVNMEYADTICRQVSNRVTHLRNFAAAHDVILFVTGAKSSNGKVLFDECRSVNPHTYSVLDPADVAPLPITNARSIGVCGATSTPRWLMERVKEAAEKLFAK